MKNIKSIMLVWFMALTLHGVSYAADKTSEGTLLVEVGFNGNSYTIERAWIIDKKLPPLKAPGNRANDISVALTDVADEILATTKIRNPRVLRGPLLRPSESIAMGSNHSDSHHVVRQDQGTFIVRLPYFNQARYIDLGDTGQRTTAIQPFSKGKQRLDLSPHL